MPAELWRHLDIGEPVMHPGLEHCLQCAEPLEACASATDASVLLFGVCKACEKVYLLELRVHRRLVHGES